MYDIVFEASLEALPRLTLPLLLLWCIALGLFKYLNINRGSVDIIAH